MKMPKTNKQKQALLAKIKNLEANKKTLMRNKGKYSPLKFYAELNKINKDIENLSKKL